MEMAKRSKHLDERVQRERDRLADRHDSMLKEIKNSREQSKRATEIWSRHRLSSKRTDQDPRVTAVFLGKQN